jgi:hypothetical protein
MKVYKHIVKIMTKYFLGKRFKTKLKEKKKFDHY